MKCLALLNSYYFTRLKELTAMNIWIRIPAAIGGFLLEIIVLDAAIRTFLLPRAANVRLSKIAAKVARGVFRILARPERSYVAKDRVLSPYASIVLLMYQVVWLALSLVVFALGFVAAGATNFARAFQLSDSSLFTLGTTAAREGCAYRP